MSGIDYAILAIVAVCFILAVISVFRNRKKGCCGSGGNCCGNCEGCAMHEKCRDADNKNNK